MLRSDSYKLLVYGSMQDCAFYDLKKDPFELHDVSKEPDYQETLHRYQTALSDFVLFHALGKVHLDTKAPQQRDQEVLNKQAEELKAFIQFAVVKQVLDSCLKLCRHIFVCTTFGRYPSFSSAEMISCLCSVPKLSIVIRSSTAALLLMETNWLWDSLITLPCSFATTAATLLSRRLVRKQNGNREDTVS